MSDQTKPDTLNGGNGDDDAELQALEEAAEGAVDATTRLEAEVGELKDRLLRAMAETENLRRRTERERDEVRKFAVSRFAEEMLAVADNLARALDMVPDEARGDAAVRALVDGVELTRKELEGALERHGIAPIGAMGARFDPHLHQAMFEVETDEAAPGTVTQVLRTGYTIHDRLLRPAMVAVAKAPAVKDENKTGDNSM